MGNRFYEKINNYMCSHPDFLRRILLLDKLITIISLISYPVCLIYIFLTNHALIFRVFLVPFISFLMVSVVRKYLPFKRPHELYNIKPLTGNPKEGRAFPSRHTFSVFMLAETYLFAISDPIAAVFYIMGIAMALCRVLLGAHEIKDVTAACIVALLCGLLYYV